MPTARRAMSPCRQPTRAAPMPTLHSVHLPSVRNALCWIRVAQSSPSHPTCWANRHSSSHSVSAREGGLTMLIRGSFSRRNFLAGSGGLLAAGPAFAQMAPPLPPGPPLGAPPAPPPGSAPGPAPALGGANQPMIDVDHALQDPIRIALPNLGGSEAAATINSVVTADLTNCGLFRPIDPAAFISAADANPTAPNFTNWKAIGAQAVVTGTVAEIGGGQVRVEFRLWDVLTGQQLQGTAYTSAQPRRIAHIMADVIYERMLGEKSYFDTRIVY